MGKGGARAFSEARGRDRVPGGGCALSLAGKGNTRAWGGDAGMWATRETWGGLLEGHDPPGPLACARRLSGMSSLPGPAGFTSREGRVPASVFGSEPGVLHVETGS